MEKTEMQNSALDEFLASSCSGLHEPDDEVTSLKQLLAEEKVESISSQRENRLLSEKKTELEEENHRLQCDNRNLNCVIYGLGECIMYLKQRIMTKQDDLNNEKKRKFIIQAQNILKNDTDNAVEIFTSEEMHEMFMEIQCQLQVLEAEVLCKDTIIDEMLQNVPDVKEDEEDFDHSTAKKEEILRLQEKVHLLESENEAFNSILDDLSQEKAERLSRENKLQEVMKKIEEEHLTLKETVVALMNENLKLKGEGKRKSLINLPD